METSDPDRWNLLLGKYYILDPDNISEATIAKVKVDDFKQRKAGTPIGVKKKEKKST